MLTASFRVLLLLAAALGAACSMTPQAPVDAPVRPNEAPPPATVVPVPAVPVPIVIPSPRIALALGGGAARGFAHVGVIKMLESQGIRPEIIAGTSAGSVVGALYAAGFGGFELQRLALDLDEKAVSDWTLPNRGFLRGEALQQFINQAVQNRTIERLDRTLGVVATDLRTGETVVFRAGNTGMAVRASSSVPGVFQPVVIGEREFVDGGVTSPIPVRAARDMGADIVIAVDIGKRGVPPKLLGTVDVWLQTFAVMTGTIARAELAGADVVIAPDTAHLGTTSFESRHLAILEGEKAALAAMPRIRQVIAEREARLRRIAESAAR